MFLLINLDVLCDFKAVSPSFSAAAEDDDVMIVDSDEEEVVSSSSAATAATKRKHPDSEAGETLTKRPRTDQSGADDNDDIIALD